MGVWGTCPNCQKDLTADGDLDYGRVNCWCHCGYRQVLQIDGPTVPKRPVGFKRQITYGQHGRIYFLGRRIA